MIEPQQKGGSVMRAGHYLVVAAVVVVAGLVAFLALSALVGFFMWLIKAAVFVAIVAGAIWLVARYARRH